MKKNNNADIKAVLVRFFISIFAVLAVTSLICGIEYSGDKAQFQMTGKHYETVDFQDIKDTVSQILNKY